MIHYRSSILYPFLLNHILILLMTLAPPEITQAEFLMIFFSSDKSVEASWRLISWTWIRFTRSERIDFAWVRGQEVQTWLPRRARTLKSLLTISKRIFWEVVEPDKAKFRKKNKRPKSSRFCAGRSEKILKPQTRSQSLENNPRKSSIRKHPCSQAQPFSVLLGEQSDRSCSSFSGIYF